MTADFAQTLHDKVPRGGKVYSESKLKSIFVEGPIKCIRHNVRVNWRLNRQLAPL